MDRFPRLGKRACLTRRRSARVATGVPRRLPADAVFVDGTERAVVYQTPVDDGSWDQPLASHPIVRAAILIVYIAAGRFALHFAFFNPSASPFWPPAGIALAAL